MKATGRMREGKRTKRIRSGLSKNESQRKNFEKLSKNLLTNGTESGIIIKRLKMRVQKIPTGRKPMGERNGFRSLSKDLRKKLQKTFRKPLDKRKEMWYNIQAVAKRWHGTARWFTGRAVKNRRSGIDLWKLNNKRWSTKHIKFSMCEHDLVNSFKRITTL